MIMEDVIRYALILLDPIAVNAEEDIVWKAINIIVNVRKDLKLELHIHIHNNLQIITLHSI